MCLEPSMFLLSVIVNNDNYEFLTLQHDSLVVHIFFDQLDISIFQIKISYSISIYIWQLILRNMSCMIYVHVCIMYY